jgi:hypothetical protein
MKMKQGLMINFFLSEWTVVSLATICLVSGLAMLCVFTVACAAGGREAGEAGRGVGMRVQWNISSYHIGKDAEWGEKEARAMLFKPLDMTSSTITFDGRTCRDVAFAKETVATGAYFQDKFSIMPQDLGLEDKTVQVVKTDCRLPGFAEYIRLQDNRLIVPMQGVLFVFQPAVTY